jgi:hypothetical protein
MVYMAPSEGSPERFFAGRPLTGSPSKVAVRNFGALARPA